MKVLKKNTNTKNTGTPKKGIARLLLKSYQKIQVRWATWMGRHADKLSLKQMKALLVLFLLLGSSLSIYLAISSFWDQQENTFFIPRIRMPAMVTDKRRAAPDGPDLLYQSIEKFRAYMDSLAYDSSGKNIYDSIRGKRPGLMDSVEKAVNGYRSLLNDK